MLANQEQEVSYHNSMQSLVAHFFGVSLVFVIPSFFQSFILSSFLLFVGMILFFLVTKELVERENEFSYLGGQATLFLWALFILVWVWLLIHFEKYQSGFLVLFCYMLSAGSAIYPLLVQKKEQALRERKINYMHSYIVMCSIGFIVFLGGIL